VTYRIKKKVVSTHAPGRVDATRTAPQGWLASLLPRLVYKKKLGTRRAPPLEANDLRVSPSPVPRRRLLRPRIGSTADKVSLPSPLRSSARLLAALHCSGGPGNLVTGSAWRADLVSGPLIRLIPGVDLPSWL
jgi:hypothetical protein